MDKIFTLVLLIICSFTLTDSLKAMKYKKNYFVLGICVCLKCVCYWMLIQGCIVANINDVSDVLAFLVLMAMVCFLYEKVTYALFKFKRAIVIIEKYERLFTYTKRLKKRANKHFKNLFRCSMAAKFDVTISDAVKEDLYKKLVIATKQYEETCKLASDMEKTHNCVIEEAIKYI